MELVLKVEKKIIIKRIRVAVAWHLVSVSKSLHTGYEKSQGKVKPQLQRRPKHIGEARTVEHLSMKATGED